MENFILHGDICYNEDSRNIRFVKDGYAVCCEGISCGVYEHLPEQYAHLPIKDYSGHLIIPGMVDLHIHAPQYAYRGTGMDLELLDWLNQYAFPEEAKYIDTEYAEKAYDIFVQQLQKSATTRAAIFATLHKEATLILMKKLEETGMIAYVGKVNMDRESPENLREGSIEEIRTEIVQWVEESQNLERVKPILTPRFIPSCTDALMKELGRLQEEYDLPIQSHLSENIGEIEWVKTLRPDARFYGEAYANDGLFGGVNKNGKPIKTLMSHCVWSSPEELELMKENNVYLVHCPASNTNVASGIAPMRKYLDKGLSLGLGSDVAGGHTESMFRAISDAVQMSKLYWRHIDQSCQPLTFAEGFYLATLAGGSFFGQVGSLAEGYEFDAVVLDDSLLPHPQELALSQRLERAIYLQLDLIGIVDKYAAGKKIS